MRLSVSFLGLLCVMSFHVHAQKYFVYLKDKQGTAFKISEPEKFLSPRSISRRLDQKINITERDLPVSDNYIAQIKAAGAKILNKSKWLNAVLIEASAAQLEVIKKLPFYNSIEFNGDIKGARPQGPVYDKWASESLVEYNYGNSADQIKQLGVDEMHKANFTGKGVLIGILDSGFLNASTLDFFKNVFSEKRIIQTWDFISNNSNVYDDHYHGTSVMSCIGGFSDTKLVGTAPEANFVLYRTEDVASETRIEEVYWLMGAEKADSIGVDVLNSSLGYNEFDNAAQSYKYSDMNGDKTICARAADFAAAVGIVVVVSAGNEGNKLWKYIATPADADSILAVGAVDVLGNVVGFSSFGPNAKNNIKPEVSARGGNTVLGLSNNSIGQSSGTSFSSPLIAGMVAGIKQAFPFLPALKIREFMIKSASIYATPNDRLGYGIPNYKKVAELAEAYKKTISILSNTIIEDSNIGLSIYPNPSQHQAPIIKFNNSVLNANDLISINDIKGNLISYFEPYHKFNNTYQKLNSGTYFLSYVKLAAKPQSIKFIKL